MSAIWGVVSRSEGEIPARLTQYFQHAYQPCVIDRMEQITEQGILMGCGIQYFTKQAEAEKLPYCMPEKDVLFTADVYLDNREELLQNSLFDGEDKETIPDGEILFRLYHTYREKCLAYVLGSYAFVYYDKKSNVIELVIDATGNRCLYYMLTENQLYFSTLLQPIAESLEEKPKWNERFLVDYLARDDNRVFTEEEETIYKGIFRVAPAQVVRIGAEGVSKNRYWEPLKKRYKLRMRDDDDAAYKEAVIKSFSESVEGTLRSAKHTGILLSGGLDSTAVACFAAPILKKREEKLYSYTMLPEEGYVNDTGERVNVNEQELVKCTVKHLENVEDYYDNFHTKNAWNTLHEQLKIWENPYKSLQNPMWIKELADKAYQDGCRVLLNGQIGNDSISYGDTEAFLYELFIKGRFRKLWKELHSRNEYGCYHKKNAVRMIWNTFWDRKGYRRISFQEMFQNTYVPDAMLKKYDVYERYTKIDKPIRRIKTMKQYQRLMVDMVRFRQLGEMETKISLATGVLMKDPTRNKRLIEFCLSTPSEQFNKNCRPRRLVYEYMKEYLTPELLDPRLPRGRQSADTFYRLRSDVHSICSTLRECAKTPNPLIHWENVLQDIQMLEKETTVGEMKNIALLQRLLYVYQIATLMKREL